MRSVCWRAPRRTGRRTGSGLLADRRAGPGRLVGEAGLQELEAGPDVEVGYTLARAAWGRGYATEAARAVLRWGFAGLRLPRVVAVADPANRASLRVLEKLGMARRACATATARRMVEYVQFARRLAGRRGGRRRRAG